MIEGHTDAKPYSNGAAYTNWELSADRANSARRHMEENGLREDQVKEVRGFADQRLLKPKDPENASNRRISVIVKYLKGTQVLAESNTKPVSGHKEKASH